MQISSAILALLPTWLGGAVTTLALGSGLGWLFREWILVRLKGSINAEYNERLEQYRRDMTLTLQQQKAQFEADLLQVRLQHEVGQTRTSLFFDHQRMAFSALTSQMAHHLHQWSQVRGEGVATRRGFVGGFVRDTEKLISDHQLFLDPDCQIAMELLVDIYVMYSAKTDDILGRQDPMNAFATANYLKVRIVALFQKKIGVPHDKGAPLEIAILGIAYYMKRYGPPPVGSGRLSALDLSLFGPDSVVESGRAVIEEISEYAIEYRARTGDFDRSRTMNEYLRLLNQEVKSTTP